MVFAKSIPKLLKKEKLGTDELVVKSVCGCCNNRAVLSNSLSGSDKRISFKSYICDSMRSLGPCMLALPMSLVFSLCFNINMYKEKSPVKILIKREAYIIIVLFMFL